VTTTTTGIDDVLARIANIQATYASIVASVNGTKTASTASSGFDSALATAQNTTSDNSANPLTNTLANVLSGSSPTATNPVGTHNGVTYSQSAQNVTGDDIVNKAKTYLGTPYVYAGNDYNGIDCSGLVQQTYKALGMDLPRISWDQQKVGTEVGSLANAQPGDVLCFGEPAYHVAIYLGNNKMIEAPKPGENVEISNVWATPSHIRRIVNSAGVSSATSTGSTSSATAPSSVSSAVAAYQSLFSAATSRYNLPTNLLAAVAQTESGGNPNAVSPAGAQGLMQLMPGTAASLGVNALIPSQAVDGAARMLSGLLTKYHGSVPLALAAYNAGPGAVDKYGGIPPYTETQNYVKKITAILDAAS
jgi:cell wall-associated NlpC family hydrolase